MAKANVVERALEPGEVEAMNELAAKTRTLIRVPAKATPEQVIARIGAYIDGVRARKRSMPRSSDTKLGLGVLWGEQLRARTGWKWVHVTYKDGFKSYGLVPRDRSCVCFPLDHIPEQLSVRKRPDHTTVLLFNMVVGGDRPRGRNSYTPFG
jgi:hypothetical protein